jgi:hypothetical protein
MTSFDWTPIRYRNVIAVLKNPFLCWRLRLREKREAHLHRRWEERGGATGTASRSEHGR